MTLTLGLDALTDRIVAILRRAGLNEVQAAALGGVIAAGERDGCKSHGI